MFMSALSKKTTTFVCCFSIYFHVLCMYVHAPVGAYGYDFGGKHSQGVQQNLFEVIVNATERNYDTLCCLNVRVCGRQPFIWLLTLIGHF